MTLIEFHFFRRCRNRMRRDYIGCENFFHIFIASPCARPCPTRPGATLRSHTKVAILSSPAEMTVKSIWKEKRARARKRRNRFDWTHRKVIGKKGRVGVVVRETIVKAKSVSSSFSHSFAGFPPFQMVIYDILLAISWNIHCECFFYTIKQGEDLLPPPFLLCELLWEGSCCYLLNSLKMLKCLHPRRASTMSMLLPEIMMRIEKSVSSLTRNSRWSW